MGEELDAGNYETVFGYPAEPPKSPPNATDTQRTPKANKGSRQSPRNQTSSGTAKARAARPKALGFWDAVLNLFR